MPYMDGVELVGWVRAAEIAAGNGRQSFVVAVSANGHDPQCIEECRAAGFDDVVSKPLTVDSIKQLLAVANSRG